MYPRPPGTNSGREGEWHTSHSTHLRKTPMCCLGSWGLPPHLLLILLINEFFKAPRNSLLPSLSTDVTCSLAGAHSSFPRDPAAGSLSVSLNSSSQGCGVHSPTCLVERSSVRSEGGGDHGSQFSHCRIGLMYVPCPHPRWL